MAIPGPSPAPSYLPDLNGVPTPGPKTALAGNSKRRQVLMTLLDALGELAADEGTLVGAYSQSVSRHHAKDLSNRRQ